MKDTWSKGTIGELPIHIGDGNYSSKYPKSRDFLPSGVPFITASDLVGGRIRADNFRFISVEQHEELKKGHLKHGDVLVVTRGNGVGNVAFVDREYEGNNVNAQLVLLRADEKELHGRFLYYLLSSLLYQAILKTFGTGSAQPQIPIWSLKRIELNYPTYSEQCAITHILGTLDDKIELNRRMNETLEAMARAIFKSWFVDFDPVRAKAEGRDPGLPKHIADLFPDHFEDSELVEIPAGWEVAPLSKVIDVNPTRAMRRGEVAPYLDMANMPTRGHSPDAVIMRPFGSGMRFVNGDTLVARITPCLENGKMAYVDFLEDGQVGWGSTEYLVLRPKHPLPNEFAYCLARSEEFREFAIQSMTGSSGRQRVPAESLSHYLLAVPPEQLAERFHSFVRPLFARASAAAHESRTLAALRDTLLPKLISGEKKVNCTEYSL